MRTLLSMNTSRKLIAITIVLSHSIIVEFIFLPFVWHVATVELHVLPITDAIGQIRLIRINTNNKFTVV